MKMTMENEQKPLKNLGDLLHEHQQLDRQLHEQTREVSMKLMKLVGNMVDVLKITQERVITLEQELKEHKKEGHELRR